MATCALDLTPAALTSHKRSPQIGGPEHLLGVTLEGPRGTIVFYGYDFLLVINFT